jgi:hypothetical protein
MRFVDCIVGSVLAYSFPGVAGTCPRPPFAGSPSDPMSPELLLERSARRPTIPTEAEVYASANVIRIQRVFPESLFDYIFPMANMGLGPHPDNGPYTYYNFLKAAAMWPHFCSEAKDGSADLDEVCKKELVSMFAHFAQEVGAHDDHSPIPTWRQGLYWFTEMGCSDDPSKPGCEYRGGTCDSTTWQGETWPCPPGVKYFGRGAKQLSYNFNYGPFSYALFKDVTVLLNNPSLVVAKDETNGWMALASAFWFYMTPQSPKPSMHDVVVGYWTPSAGDRAGNRLPGFGVLIMIINGGIECGGSVEVQQAANRITYYTNFLTAFGLPAEAPSTLTCTRMQQFDQSSSGFTPSYWEKSWSTLPCGHSCQLVSYQTGFSMFDDPDSPDTPYEKCINYYFGPQPTVDPSQPTTTPGPTAGPTTLTPANACKACDVCIAVPDNYQAATNEQCSPCGAKTGQSWWPCNVAGLCQCDTPGVITTLAPVTTPVATSTPATTPAPVTTSAPVTTPAPITTASPGLSCKHCSSCVAIPGNPQSASNQACSACANGAQLWWPCNVSGLCQCDGPTNPTTAAPPVTSVPVGNACAECEVCEAVPGNFQAASDEACAACGSKTLQAWWPCPNAGLCRCKTGGV